MKSYKFLAFAALAITTASCTSEDAAENAFQSDSNAIVMQPYITGVSSRASHVASEMTKGYDFHKYGFSVWANVHEGTSGLTKSFMTDQKVSFDEAATGNQWFYAPIKYWPTEAGSSVDFYPIWKGIPGTTDEQNIKIDEEKNGNIPHTTFIVNETVKDQSDFLWASPIFDAKRSQYVGTPVHFQFKHATTAFEFALKVAGIKEEVTRVAVESVTLSGHFAPKAFVNAEATNLNDMWTYEGNYGPIRSYTISDPEEEMIVGAEQDYYTSSDFADITRSGSVMKDPTGTDESLGYYKGTMMVLPFSNNYTVTLKYTVYTWPTEDDKTNGNSNYSKETYTISRDVEGVDLKLGYLYKNLITLTLQPVEFSAQLIDWNIVTKEYDLMDSAVPTSPAASIDGTSYPTLADALAALPTDGTPKTVKLTDDVDVPSGHLEIPAGAKVTLDLNGFSIDSETDYTGGVIRVLSGAELILDDTSAGQNGGVNAPDVLVAVRPVGTAKVTINGGTYVGKGYAVSGNGTESGSDITINGGTFIASDGPAVYHPQNGKLTIKGGTFKGSESALEIRAGELTIDGGEFQSTASSFSCNANGNGTTTTGAAIAIAQHTTKKDIKVTINGGTFKAVRAINESNPQANDPAPQVDLQVKGGNFYGAVEAVDALKFIEGGSFDREPADKYMVDGKTKSYSNGTWTVQ